MKITIAQLEVIPRKPFENEKKVSDVLVQATREGASIVAFSEMFLPGYLVGDQWERLDFLKDCRAALDKVVALSMSFPKLTIIIGSVDFDEKRVNEDGRVRKYNTAFVIRNGEIVNKIVKSLQPNYREFEDNRHFYDNRKLAADMGLNIREKLKQNVVLIPDESGESKIGVLLCEDGWDIDYTVSPTDILAQEYDVDMVINISCSPYTFGKTIKRHRVFSSAAKRNIIPIVYVNNTGVQNNGKNVFTFDGGSCLYSDKGETYSFFQTFTTGIQTFDPFNAHNAYWTPVDITKTEGVSTLYSAVSYGTRKFCERMGIKKVVIGASGGIDSAVSACLFTSILGKENVVLINMPSQYNSSLTKNAAKKLAENLGVRYEVIPIGQSVSLTEKQMIKANFPLTPFMLENVQARDRSSRILAAVAASFGGVFTCNANKSESTVGYTTLYGDLGGFLAPLADLWKTQVYEVADYINANWYLLDDKCVIKQGMPVSPIPIKTIEVVASAELSADQDVTKGKGDPINYPYHDKLFASWVERWDRATPETCLKWYLDGILAKQIGYDEACYRPISELFGNAESFIKDLERWWNLYDGFAVAKRIQSPPCITVSRRSFGYDHRETQEPPYYSQAYLDMKKRILGHN